MKKLLQIRLFLTPLFFMLSLGVMMAQITVSGTVKDQTRREPYWRFRTSQGHYSWYHY